MGNTRSLGCACVARGTRTIIGCQASPSRPVLVELSRQSHHLHSCSCPSSCLWHSLSFLPLFSFFQYCLHCRVTRTKPPRMFLSGWMLQIGGGSTGGAPPSQTACLQSRKKGVRAIRVLIPSLRLVLRPMAVLSLSSPLFLGKCSPLAKVQRVHPGL